MRLGIDIDGCIYQWERTARYLLREEFGYSKDGPLGKESTHWDYIQENVKPEEWKWLWTDGHKKGLLRHGHLYKGAMTVLRKLAEKHDLIIITHRGKNAVNDTLQWLAFLDLPLSGIHILTKQEPKSEVPCDIYIDDKPSNVLELCNNSDAMITALMSRPWNQSFITNLRADAYEGYIARVSSWEAFAALVREYE